MSVVEIVEEEDSEGEPKSLVIFGDDNDVNTPKATFIVSGAASVIKSRTVSAAEAIEREFRARKSNLVARAATIVGAGPGSESRRDLSTGKLFAGNHAREICKNMEEDGKFELKRDVLHANIFS